MTAPSLTTDLIAYNFNLDSGNPFDAMLTPTGHLGQSFLHELAREGDVLSAEVLMLTGREMDLPDDQGRRPLHEAAFFGHIDMADFLIQNGAVVNAPVHPFGYTPLYFAVEQGHVEMMKLLVKRGADLNVTDQLTGEGLLHLAAKKGHVQIVGLLIAFGVNVFHESKKGETARDIAAKYRRPELESILLKVMMHHARYGG